ncbi:MAG: TonB-dependent receptor [Acidobacteriota bacterium]|nr:TonB-dependent receptor [Acidobacteriota bacterium]
MGTRRFHLFTLAALTTLSLSLSAQSTGVTTADLRGSVRTASGAPVAKATVRLTQDSTNQTRVLATDASGNYAFRLLPPGSYTLLVEATGYSSKRVKDLILRLGSTMDFNVNLTGVEASATVEVVGENTIVDPTRTQVSAVVDNNLINNLPINRRRFEDFSLTTPGVSTANSPDNGGTASNSGLTFAGVNPRSNNVMVDGLDNNDVSTGSVRSTFSQEAVQEFQVVANGFSAEYGRAAGGTVNVVTKSGGNQFSGGLFYFRREGSLDAKRPMSSGDQKFSQSQYGATVSGSIVKDKLFYFVSVERFEKNDTNNVTIAPSVADSIRQNTGFQVSQGQIPWVEYVTTGIVKLDWNQSEVSRWSLRTTWAKEYNENQQEWGGLIDRSAGGARRIEDKSVSLSNLYNASSRFVNDFRILYSLRDHELISLDATNGPYVEILGAATYGTQRFLPQPRTEKSYQLVDTASFFFDKHSLKIGVDVMRTSLVGTLPLNFAGIYRFQQIPGFANGLAALNAVNPYGGHGLPAAFVQGFGADYLDFDTDYQSAFIQDDWQITPKFTLKLGVRYDREKLPAFKDTADYNWLNGGALSAPNVPGLGPVMLSSGSIEAIPGATGATATGNGPYDFAANFKSSHDWSSSKVSPRLAFTWQATPLTRIYGGYGTFVGRTQLGPYSAVFLENGTDLLTVGRRAPNAFASWAGADGGSNRRYNNFATAVGSPAKGGKVLLLPGDYSAPETNQANLGLEYSPRPNLKLSFDAVYSKGKNFMNVRDVNAAIPVPAAYRAAGSPDTRTPVLYGPTGIPYSAIYRYDSTGESKYTGGTLGFAWQLRDTISINASYTYSKAEDNYIDWLTQFASQNTFDPKAEMSPSNQDQKNRLNFSAVFNTKNASSVWAKNWIISFIGRFTSGRPYSLWTGVDADYGYKNGAPIGNGEGLSAPADRAAGVGRNTETTSNIYNLDMRLSRTFHFGGAVNLETILEVFNVFNHYNVSKVQNFQTPPPGAPAFGTPIVTSSDFNRQFQVGVKLTF